MVRGKEKNKERKSGVKEKGQNTSGSGFTATEIPIWKKKVSSDRTPISFQIKKKAKRPNILYSNDRASLINK